MHKIYFTTGELAKLCGIKKTTLFHYDEIGILKPEYLAENGYRYYSEQQIFTYELIAMLRSIDTPLSEIKTYMEGRSPETLIQLLKEKMQQLEAKRRRIEQQQRLLENTIAETSQALEMQCNGFSVVEQPESSYILTALPPEGWDSKKAAHLCMQEHIRYCEQKGFDDHFPIGEVVRREDFEQGRVVGSFLCSRTERREEDPRLFVRPAGSYAVIHHQGYYDTVPEAVRRLREEIKARGYRAVGDVFEEDQIYYLATADEDAYVVKLSVMVER